jgi:hypothetical protein
MSAYVERPSMNLKTRLDLCKGFRVQVSVLVDYVAALLECWCLKIREMVVVSSTLVQCPLPPSDVVLFLRRRSLQLHHSGSPKSCEVLSLRLPNLHNISLNLSSILKLSIPCIFHMVIISLIHQVLIIIHVFYVHATVLQRNKFPCNKTN